MGEELSYQIINTSNYKHFQCWRKQPRQRYTFLNSFKRDLAKHIYITLGVYEFLNIHIFNWYKALYLASSSTFRHLDFIRAVRWLCAASPMVYS